MEELLQACEGFPEVALTFTGEKTYYVVGDEVPELVAYDASTVFTEAKARSLEEIFVEGQVIFQAMYMADSEPLDAFQNAVQDRLSQSYSTVRSQDYIFEIMPQGATKASGLKHLAENLELLQIKSWLWVMLLMTLKCLNSSVKVLPWVMLVTILKSCVSMWPWQMTRQA